MQRRVVSGLLTFVLLAAAGCSKCGKDTKPVPGAPAGITQKLPKDVELAVVIPDVSAIGEKIKLLQDLKTANFAAQLQGFGSGADLATSFMQQVGVDLRSKEEIEKIGIDPSRGAGVAVLKENASYAVVAVKDEAKLKSFLKHLAQNRLGAGIESTWEDGRRVTTWARSGTTPALGYTVKDGFAFIAANASKEKLRGYAELAEASALSAEPSLDVSLKRLPEKRDLFLYAPLSSQMAKQATLAGGTAVVNLAADSLVISVDMPWPGLKEHLHVLTPAGADTHFDKLATDAFAVMRFGGDPSKLGPFLPDLLPYIVNAFKNAGVELQPILDNVKPGISASLSVASTIRFDQRPEFDVRRTNPFRFVHLVAVGQPEDEAKAKALFAKLPEVTPKFGAQMKPEQREGNEVLVTSYPQGEGVHLALVKGTVVAASPLARMDETVARLSRGEPSSGPFSDPKSGDFFNDRALGVFIDLHRLADSIRNLPGDAWGPGGSFVKAGWMRWLDGMDDLRAVTVAVAAKDDSAQAEISLRFQKK